MSRNGSKKITLTTPPYLHVNIHKAQAPAFLSLLDSKMPQKAKKGKRARRKGMIVKYWQIRRANNGSYQTYEVVVHNMSQIDELKKVIQNFRDEVGCELEDNTYRPQLEHVF